MSVAAPAVKTALWTIIVIQGLWTCGKLVRKYILVPRLTILADLPNLGTQRKDGRLNGTAVICGASIAGLLSAAVCADHFHSVLIVDPEDSSNTAEDLSADKRETRTGAHGAQVPVPPRKRIPQWFAMHNYLPPMYMGLQRLFPTLQLELEKLNVKPVVMQARLGSLVDPYRDHFQRNDLDGGAPLSVPLTRGGLETLLRRLVKTGRPNVRYVVGTVTAVRKGEAPDERLEKVVIRTETGLIEEDASLVVDATGPTQAGFSRWLKDAGYPSLPLALRHAYDPNLQVVTGFYTVPVHLQAKIPIPWGWRPGLIALEMTSVPLGEDRSFISCVSDHNQLLIAMYGKDFHDRPRSASQFHDTLADFAGNKRGPRRIPHYLFEMLDFLSRHEEECSACFADHSMRSFSWVRYDQAPVRGSIPSNFVAVGDAVMNLSPLGGRGGTKAMYDAVTLDECLRRCSPNAKPTIPIDFSRMFFRKQALRIQDMWRATKDGDYAWSQTTPVEGETLDVGKWRRTFMGYVGKLCAKDPEAYAHFWHVLMHLAPPTDVFLPWFLVRVARQWLA